MLPQPAAVIAHNFGTNKYLLIIGSLLREAPQDAIV